MSRVIVYGLFGLLLSLSADSLLADPEVKPGNVYAQVKELAVLVERIRQHMGVPKTSPLELSVSDAQPHDVFYQALTLFRNTNQLLFQVTRYKVSIPETGEIVYQPADVLKLTSSAQQNLFGVLTELGLPRAVETGAGSHGEKNPSDVFMAIQAVNRQINLLLEKPHSPSDVYMQVTLAIGYCARQLARYPNVRRIPEAPRVAPGRVPSDVYFHLLDGLERLQKIYQLKGLSTLSVDAGRLKKEDITPSDVFDIASLLVARLDFLHKLSGIREQPRDPYYPGRVYPTDVYRQAGILLSQLDTLIGHYSQTR